MSGNNENHQGNNEDVQISIEDYPNDPRRQVLAAAALHEDSTPDIFESEDSPVGPEKAINEKHRKMEECRDICTDDEDVADVMTPLYRVQSDADKEKERQEERDRKEDEEFDREAKLDTDDIEIRKRRWYDVVIGLRFPFSYSSILLWAVLAAVLGIVVTLFSTVLPETNLKGERVRNWSVFVLILIGIYIAAGIVVGAILYAIGKRSPGSKVFYFAVGARTCSATLLVGIAGLVMQATYMADLEESVSDGLKQFFISVIVVSVCYFFRVMGEKMLILRVSEKTYAKVNEAIYKEKLLRRLLRLSQGESENSHMLLRPVRDAGHVIKKLHGVGTHVGSTVFSYARRRPTESEDGRSQKDMAARIVQETEGESTVHTLTLERRSYLRGPGVFLERRKGRKASRVPLGSQTLYLEKKKAQDKRAAEDAAKIVFNYLDAENKGYVEEEDFTVLTDRPYRRQRAFFVFNRNMFKYVSFEDMRNAIEDIFLARDSIARGLQDREDVANIVRMCFGGLFWSLMFIVVLLIFEIDIETVVLPYLSIMLAFSFAFGVTLRNMLESAILVLIITPFEVGDRITLRHIDGVLIVDRITLFNTICHRTNGEYIEVANSEIISSHVVNHHRSFPYSFFLRVEIKSDSINADIISRLVRNTKQFCEDSPTFMGNPGVWLDEHPDANTMVVKFHVATRNGLWSVPAKWRSCRTEFLVFMYGQEVELGIRFSYPDQPFTVQKK